MRTRRIITLGVCILAVAHTPARGAGNLPAHEIWLGAGGAASFEKDVFNVVADFESSPEAAYSLVYLANLNARLAVGLHIYGGSETSPEFLIQDQSGVTQLVKLDLNTFNFGARGRYTFTRATLSPYVLAGLSLAGGSIDSKVSGELTYTGVSACVGAGAGIGLGRHFMLSAEGFGSFGTANWKQPPFGNSSGKEFNPSIAGGTINLGFVWGTKM